MYVILETLVVLSSVISGVKNLDKFANGFDYSESPLPNVTLLNPRGLRIAFEGQHWIKSFTLVMNINIPFRYDPFNFFQNGQIKETLTKKKMVIRRTTTTTYWIYENKNLQLIHGDEIYYYLKVKLLDNKLFTKLYHYLRVVNDTDLSRLVIDEEQVHLFNIREFLIKNNFTFQALGNYRMRRARSEEFAQLSDVPVVGRIRCDIDEEKFVAQIKATRKTFEEYIQ